ncbi:tetratricopeptide repeat protein [Bdellovibrio bacteriovorus]|uniref:tetratricopeptide repeat protein n=1 Tax=Bdellovibrio bacteriovorus TaxID=959 RepID=UPI0035A7117D
MMKKGLLVLSLSAGVAAHAQNVATAGTTQDLLIQKLTQVQVGLAPADPARVAVLLRLADLHAERARQLSMKELADGCVVCKAGEKDRQKALSYYSEALTKVSASSAAKVHLQMGHLYELQGQNDLAEKSYLAMLSSSSSPVEMAEANLSLAEMAFRKSDFTKAEALYGKVLATEGASSQGLAAYRKAWCAFRMNNLDSSLVQLEEILKNPKLQSRMASGRGVADPQFLEEVSRDMATFMAARGIKDGDAEKLYSLSPEAFKLQQVTLLAREGLRLGQKEATLKVWDFVYQKQADVKGRLEAQVRMAQLHFDLKNTAAAANAYQMGLSLWGATDCTLSSCEESAKGLRQFVVGWNRIENAKPSAELLTAYDEYFKVFSDDEDMYVWGAQAAAQANQYAQAATWTALANKVILAEYQGEKDAAQQKALAEKLEKNLLLGIENAEKSKDEALLASAQEDYLQKSVLKQKTFDVQYQKAYAVYQKGNYPVAAEQLRQLAVEGKGPRQIQIQAAELSLDALAILKDDARIQQWASDYATKFADKKAEFQHVQQKSILTQSAKLAAAQPDQALAALASFSPAAASAEDRKIYLKNKILLNEKLNKITEARVAVEDLLRETTLTAEEREFALGRKVWFAELELDFATALKAAEQMQFGSLSQDEKVLKLALYSELADKDPKNYYSQYLKQSKDAEKKALIATQLIRLSKSPVKDLETYKPYFKDNAGLFARASLEVYGMTGDKKVLEKALKEKGSNKQDAFVMIEKIMILGDVKALEAQVAAHQLDTKNQNTIASSLKARVKLLEKVDALANRAIASGDFSSQLLALQLVSKENSRFYNEVLSLPMPAGLTPEQESEYLTILSQQVAPNQNTATMADAKLKEFWEQKSTLDSYKAFSTQNSEWAKYIVEEVNAVAAVAPEAQKASWTALAADIKASEMSQQKPSLAELEKARTNLKQNPFAAAAIQEALTLEKKAQRKSMVEYLESRLASLEKKDSEVKGNQQ